MFHLKFKAMTNEQKNKKEINKLKNQIQWALEEQMNKNLKTTKYIKTALIDDDTCVTAYKIVVKIKTEVYTNNDPF